MSFSPIHDSYRNAARVPGVALIHDGATSNALETPTGNAHMLRKHFRSIGQVDSDRVVWDVPNPFEPPDPVNARLQAGIARARRIEFTVPHENDPFGGEDVATKGRDDAFNSEGDAFNGVGDVYGGEDDVFDGEGDTYGDEVEFFDCEDDFFDCEEEIFDRQDTLLAQTVALPRLLPIPLRSLPSPPPPTPVFSDGKGSLAPWDDLAEAAERAARRAKRDAHRSHLKVLATLGPTASSAL